MYGKSYTDGEDSEERLVHALKLRPEPKNTHNQMFLDIDAWDASGRAISIKTQNKCLETGNLLFELEVEDAVSGWHDSWWLNGTATVYIFIVGKRFFKFHKATIQSYVEQHGWDRRVQNSAAVKRDNASMGHRHLDARSGLINLQRLIKFAKERKASAKVK